MHLFGQLKRIASEWLESSLVCKGDTLPALLMYRQLADMACNRIVAGITATSIMARPGSDSVWFYKLGMRLPDG